MKSLLRLYWLRWGYSVEDVYTPYRDKLGYFLSHREMYERDLIEAVSFVFDFIHNGLLALLALTLFILLWI